MPKPPSPIRFPTELADRCVMCGMCLPHCPTYRLSRDEGESPRGRIALMIALDRGQLEPSAKLRGHLDRCLSCRACERICPSKVPYGKLLDSTRALLEPGGDRRHALLDRVLTRPRRLQRLAGGLRLLQRSGLDRLAPLAGLGHSASLLPPLRPARQWRDWYAHDPAVPERGPVALFTGCTGSVLDADSVDAAIALLIRLGHGVHVPVAQGCCGALHQHGGDPAGAQRLADGNRQTFGGLAVDAVLGIASACTLQMAEQDQTRGTAVLDAAAFLAEADWPDDLVPKRLDTTVALHYPCTQAHGLRSTAATRSLLQRIPGLELVELETRGRCCGAAGSYMLREPNTSDALGRETLDDIIASGSDTLLTSNIGCRLQLQAVARRQGIKLQVLHPLTLVQRQLGLTVP